jgi:hypothetical protein
MSALRAGGREVDDLAEGLIQVLIRVQVAGEERHMRRFDQIYAIE